MPKTQDFRVTECEPNLKLGLEIFSGPIRGSKIRYSLENIEGKTKLTETADFNVSGIFKLLIPFIDRPGKAEKEATDRQHKTRSGIRSEIVTRALPTSNSTAPLFHALLPFRTCYLHEYFLDKPRIGCKALLEGRAALPREILRYRCIGSLDLSKHEV